MFLFSCTFTCCLSRHSRKNVFPHTLWITDINTDIPHIPHTDTDTDIPHIPHTEPIPIPGSYRFFSYRYRYRVSLPGIGTWYRYHTGYRSISNWYRIAPHYRTPVVLKYAVLQYCWSRISIVLEAYFWKIPTLLLFVLIIIVISNQHLF